MLINSVALVRLTHDNAGGRHLIQGIMMSMLVLQLEAKYQGNDDAYKQNVAYPILAITKSDDIDTATENASDLMAGNGWGDFNYSRYGTIKGSTEAPKSFGDPKDWQKSLNEYGAIYIVYTK